jgi:hypothetical protein
MGDDLGSVCCLFMDSNDKLKLSDYVDSGGKLPNKNDIVIVSGSKGDDIIFVDKINILKDKIYMKLSQIK